MILYSKTFGASNYINLPDGKQLYEKVDLKNNLNLLFAKTNNKIYENWLSKDGLPLSILDTIARFSLQR